MPLSPDLEDILYVEAAPYTQGHLKVSDLHEIYWQAYGNKNGIPVLCLHGGPGSGMSSWHPRLFDLEKYHVILFDQRGCGKSTPFAELADNTTPHLVQDIEQLRAHFAIDDWHIFGGSWGSTLALAYADQHAERVKSMVLYGIFLARPSELAAITDPNGPAAQLFPEYYEKFSHMVPAANRHNLGEAYNVLFHTLSQREDAIRNWCHWEMRIMNLNVDESFFNTDEEDIQVMTALSLLEHHYFAQNGFINGDNILSIIGDKMKGKPVSIVQGRYDLVCPARTAYELHKAIPHSTLEIIATAGHTAKNVGTMRSLKQICSNLK